MDTDQMMESVVKRYHTDAAFCHAVDKVIQILEVEKQKELKKGLNDEELAVSRFSAGLTVILIEQIGAVKAGYDRDLLVEILVYHYRKDNSSCGCGWAELGRSHPEHVANVYEECILAKGK